MRPLPRSLVLLLLSGCMTVSQVYAPAGMDSGYRQMARTHMTAVNGYPAGMQFRAERMYEGGTVKVICGQYSFRDPSGARRPWVPYRVTIDTLFGDSVYDFGIGPGVGQYCEQTGRG